MEIVNNQDELRLTEIKKVKARLIELKTKLMDLTNNYYYFLSVIEKTNGNLEKVPDSINNVQKEINEALAWVLKTYSLVYIASRDLNIKEISFELSSYERKYNESFKKYNNDLYELINLYLKKTTDTNYSLEKSSINENEQVSTNSDYYDDNDYKSQVLKVLDLFNVYGVTDEKLIKYVERKDMMLEERAKSIVLDLNDVINFVAPDNITNRDVLKIKKVLSSLGRMKELDEDTKNNVYDEIKFYIEDLSNRKSHSK